METLIEKLKDMIFTSKLPTKLERAAEERGYMYGINLAVGIAESHNPWTKVEDDLPVIKEDGYSVEVLVQFDDKDLGYCVGEYASNGKWFMTGIGSTNLVTEWMYIPKGAKQ